QPGLVRVFAQNLAGIDTAAFFLTGFFLSDQGHRAIAADGQDIVAFFQVRKGLAVLHVRAEASNASEDRLAVVRRQSDFARKRKEAERPFEIDVVRRNAFRDAGALGLLDFPFFLALFRLWHLYLLVVLQ